MLANYTNHTQKHRVPVHQNPPTGQT